MVWNVGSIEELGYWIGFNPRRTVVRAAEVQRWPNQKSLKLGARPLRLADLRRVYAGPVPVAIDAQALRRRRARRTPRRCACGRGCARLRHQHRLRAAGADAHPAAQRTLLQRNIILSHSAGVGPLLDDAIVRLTLVLKLASLLQGFSGVSEELARFLERLINAAS